MRSSVFGKWVIGRPLKAHVFLPAFLSFLMVAMYYSTVPFLQDLVAPGSARPAAFSLAGRGALELLQAFFLLCIFFFTIRCLMIARGWMAQLWILLLLLGTIAVFLEEVDFGSSAVNLVTGLTGQGAPAAIPAAGSAPPATGQYAGEAVAGYIKLAGSALLLLFFFLAPMLFGNSRNRTLRLIVPSMWVLATVTLVVAMDRFAHFLENAGLGTIDGMPGPLTYDTAEFRELLIYYLVLVYVAGLHERVVVRQ